MSWWLAVGDGGYQRSCMRVCASGWSGAIRMALCSLGTWNPWNAKTPQHARHRPRVTAVALPTDGRAALGGAGWRYVRAVQSFTAEEGGRGGVGIWRRVVLEIFPLVLGKARPNKRVRSVLPGSTLAESARRARAFELSQETPRKRAGR